VTEALRRDVSLAQDWLPAEIAHSVRHMPDLRIMVIESTHDPVGLPGQRDRQASACTRSHQAFAQPPK